MEGVVVLGGSARCYVYTSRGPWGIPEQGTDTPNSLKEPCKAGVSFRGVSCLRPYAAGRGSSKVLRQWSGSQHLIKSQMAAVKCDHNVIIKPRFLCQHLGFGIKLSTKPTAANWAVCALQKRTATSGFAAGRATNLSTWAYWFFWGGGVGIYLHDPDPQMILCGAEVTSFRNKRDPLRALLSPEAVLIHMQMMSSSQAVNTHMVVLDTGLRRCYSAANWSKLFWWLTKEQKHHEREKLLFLGKLPSDLCILDTKTDKRPPRTPW